MEIITGVGMSKTCEYGKATTEVYTCVKVTVLTYSVSHLPPGLAFIINVGKIPL